MRYRTSRFLQVLGMCILPTGIAGNVLHPQTVTEGVMLTICGTGVLVFLIGWLLQGSRKA